MDHSKKVARAILSDVKRICKKIRKPIVKEEEGGLFIIIHELYKNGCTDDEIYEHILRLRNKAPRSEK